MSIGSRLKNASITFQIYARTSTIHGLLHVFQSTSTLRQGFWVILAVVGFLFGLYHFILTTNKYLNLPVNAQFKPSHETSKFPCVTICSLKPVSEELYHDFRIKLYMSHMWDNLANWITKDHLKYFSEQNSQENYEILRHRINQLHQVMWVSADTRDLGIRDNTMILDCNFNGVKCNQRHFKLRQNYKYWNCYTIDSSLLHDSDQWRLRGHQLDMTLFINVYDDRHVKTGKYGDNCVPDRTDNRTTSSIDDSLLCSIWMLCPNQVMQHNGSQTSGIRVFLHQKGEYPLSSKDFIDIQTGRASTISLNPLHRKLLSRWSHKCIDFNNEKVKYISYFGVHLSDADNVKYNKTEYEFVYEEKQSIVFNKCKCYSHRYHFSSSMRSKLCYYTPPEQWKTPSDVTMQNIQCHDEAVEAADNRTSELAQKYQDKTLCDQMRYRPMMQSLPWPKFEYIKNIWEDLFVPKIISGTEFTELDDKKHHIFNYTRLMEFKSDFKPNIWNSREEILLGSVLYSGSNLCKEFLFDQSNRHKQRLKYLPVEKLINLGWCIRQKALSRNLAQVRIRLPSSMTDVYEESSSFEWTEAVSEIGGTFGLWIGVSLMVIVELLELFIVVIVSFIKNERLGHSVVIEVPINESTEIESESE